MRPRNRCLLTLALTAAGLPVLLADTPTTPAPIAWKKIVVDKVFLPTEVDLITWRLLAALAAVGLMLFGLVWEED